MISIPIWFFVLLLIPYGFAVVMFIIAIIQAIIASYEETKREEQYEMIGRAEEEGENDGGE